MRKFALLMAICLLAGCYQGNLQKSAQPNNSVVRRASDYVLIGTDKGIGEVNDEIAVYRMTNTGVVQIGRVKILKFQNGEAAARIIEEKAGYQVSAGDIVPVSGDTQAAAKTIETVSEPKPANRNYLAIISGVLATTIILLLLITARDGV
jgi:hypothetical protein